MALITYNNTDVTIEEGMTFVSGSWVCIADGLGGFSSYLVDLVSTLPHPARSPNAFGDLVGKLSNLKIANPISTQVEFWIDLLLTILGYIPGIVYALYVLVA
ncbi:hypothetical protein BAE44_0004912 [Dichanthelium oligosanthes]|uniref:Uncharacterized protein n=1 Tax=Dichanthelium oligosanthes TaxID=888268 RepID=A0A1E5W9Z2_9POAL|nr:hypothetical protein BAE44_0004912 [Dichanthelium oligosanthes]